MRETASKRARLKRKKTSDDNEGIRNPQVTQEGETNKGGGAEAGDPGNSRLATCAEEHQPRRLPSHEEMFAELPNGEGDKSREENMADSAARRSQPV